MTRDFTDRSGLNPALLNQATASETNSLLIAFAFSVAETHPDPQSLLVAFERNRRQANQAAQSVPGADNPEMRYAIEAGQALGRAICQIIASRVGS